MQMLLETKGIDEIPVLTLVPPAATHVPFIFFIPGCGGTKEVGLSPGVRSGILAPANEPVSQ